MLSEFQEADSEWDLDDIQCDDLTFESPTPAPRSSRQMVDLSTDRTKPYATFANSDLNDAGTLSECEFEFDDDEEPFKLSSSLSSTPLVHKTTLLSTFYTPAQFPTFKFDDVTTSPQSVSSSRLYTPSLYSASSPAPSSNNSMIASESEDEGYDDIFGDFSIKERGLGLGKLARFTYDELDEAEDDDYCLGLDDGCDQLVLPQIRTLTSDALEESARLIEKLDPKSEAVTTLPQLATLSIKKTQQDAPRKLPVTSSKCNYLRPTTASQAKQTLPKNTLMRTARNAQVFGDGSELDSIDDLIVSKTSESRFVKKAKNAVIQREIVKSDDSAKRALLRPLGGVGRVRNLGDVSRFGSVSDTRRTPVAAPAKKEKAPKKKPTLIRSLNVPMKQTVGDMVYNPKLQTWEGNDDCLLDFDRIADAKTIRPSLITNSTLPEKPNDDQQMCWTGNEEEEDIFADFAAEPLEPEKSAIVNDEFILTKHLKESFCISESSHKLWMGSWYSKANSRNIIRDTSRAHLYDIRRV